MLVTLALAVALLLGVGDAAGPQGPADGPAQLQRCYNEAYNSTPRVFEDFLAGRKSSLYLHRVLWSHKEETLPLTIFVGLTPERLAALEAQCRSWGGPHASAIYVPLLQSDGSGLQLSTQSKAKLADVEHEVQQLFDRMEADVSACQMVILLLYEVVSDPAMALILPINQMRNAALLPARTPLVAMVDVDLAPSATLRTLMQQSTRVADLQRSCDARSVWVMPAWETHKRLTLEEGTSAADAALSSDKAHLQELSSNGILVFFAQLVYRRGHQATNFTRWLASNDAYEIQYEVNYEPWFIMSRRLSPPYDIRFRGYGWNKVQQVALVAAQNFTFVATPDVWLVHRPHAPSAGQAIYKGDAESETRAWKGQRATLAQLFHRRVSALRHVTVRDMRRGTYVAVVDTASAGCRQQLQWWWQQP